jgi:hypothetical protein
MPWSPVPRIPEVLKNLKARGYKNRVGYEALRIEIIRVLGVTSNKTITSVISIMDLLGYIKDSGSGAIFWICQDELYKFAQENEKTIVEELDAKYGIS